MVSLPPVVAEQSPSWHLSDRLGRNPLVPLAVTLSVGVWCDRLVGWDLEVYLIVGAVSIVCAVVARERGRTALALGYLGILSFAVGGVRHQTYRSIVGPDDIAGFAQELPRLVRLQGRLLDEPTTRKGLRGDALRSLPRADRSYATLEVTALHGDQWFPVSGRLALRCEGELADIHLGDIVEVLGWLERPTPPLNPGEFDVAERLADQGIQAILATRAEKGAIVRLDSTAHESIFGLLARLRRWGRQTLVESVDDEEAALATALLLGDGGPMTQSAWDRYVRTGVVHVLAISGQHLVILAGFGWFVLRLLDVPRRRGAILIAGFVFGYALLTGARPAAIRAAVMVLTACLGIILRRRAPPGNTLALAWIVVLLIQPTDIATIGCQLSFLAVAVLLWAIPKWYPPKAPSPGQQLIEDSRSPIQSISRYLGRMIVDFYIVTGLVSLAVMPLSAWWQSLISPIGLLIGPPLIVLTSIALVSGFLLLFSSGVLFGSADVPCAFVLSHSLRCCDLLTGLGDAVPGGAIYVGQIPGWWVLGVYLPATTHLLRSARPTERRPGSLGVVLWFLVLIPTLTRALPDGLRVTFLAVGHGGCTVIETNDGRVFLYDTGAIHGPEFVGRIVAPFLWQRGIYRIDQVFLSHADLDHFNGLPDLLRRFRIAGVTMTPTFEQKETKGVDRTLAALRDARVPLRIATVGTRYPVGELTIEVLHPPASGPPGTENSRSMVLLLSHRGRTILLTGDIEKEGSALLRQQAIPRIDVLMAPHHGSPEANSAAFVDWARPRLAVSCQGPPRDRALPTDIYEERGIAVLGTWPHGAVTIHSRRDGLLAETFRSGRRLLIRLGNESGP